MFSINYFGMWRSLVFIAFLATGLSQITTQLTTNETRMPTCRYGLYTKENKDEVTPIKLIVPVETMVSHRWRCEGGNQNLFCMKVHDCTVNDEVPERQNTPIIDDRGCGNPLFKTPDYTIEDGKLEAITDVKVFRPYSNSSKLFFKCTVSLMLKTSEDGKENSSCGRAVTQACHAQGRRNLEQNNSTKTVATHSVESELDL